MITPNGDVASRECCCGGVSQPDSTASWANRDEELAALAKAIAHPARVQILRVLLAEDEGKCICGDICEQIPLAQSTVSQHLKVLKSAGLICGEVDGPRVCYSVDRRRLWRLCELIATLHAPYTHSE